MRGSRGEDDSSPAAGQQRPKGFSGPIAGGRGSWIALHKAYVLREIREAAIGAAGYLDFLFEKACRVLTKGLFFVMLTSR